MLEHNGIGNIISGNQIEGDLVNGDKVIQIIQSENSLGTVKNILVQVVEYFHAGKVEEARLILSTLTQLANNSKEVTLTITAIKTIYDEENVSDAEAKIIINAFSQAHALGSEARDIVNAAGLSLIIRKKGTKEAKTQYFKLSSSMYSQQVFYRHLADVGELKSVLQTEASLDKDTLLIAVDRSIGFNEIDLAKALLNKIKSDYPLQPHKFEKHEALIECVALNDFAKRDYYLLSEEDKARFDNASDSIINYCRNNEVKDGRVAIVAAQLLRYTHFTHIPLLNISEALVPLMEEKNFYGLEEIENFFKKSKEKEHSISISEAKQSLVENSNSTVCQIGYINIWLELGSGEATLTVLDALYEKKAFPDFCMLAAKAIGLLGKRVFPTTKLLKVFEIESELTDIFNNIGYVDALAEAFLKEGKQELGVLAYKKGFRESIPWLSPPYVSYLTTLVNTKQLTTLSSLLGAMSIPQLESEEIIELRARVASLQSEHSVAVKLLEKNIEKYNNRIESLNKSETSQFIRYLACFLEECNKINRDKVPEVINEIPLTILNNPDDENNWVLLAYLKHKQEAPRLILEWFFSNPHKYARYIIDLIMDFSGRGEKLYEQSECSPFYGAIVFNQNGNNEKIRVLVDEELVSCCPEYFINVDGEMAQLMEDSKPGEMKIYKGKFLTLKEKLPTPVAAFRIASNIMDEDEKVVFHMLKFDESDIEKSIELIQQVTRPNEEALRRIEHIFLSPYPINIKLDHIRATNIVDKALEAFLRSDFHFQIGNVDREIELAAPKNMVFDEVGIIFVALIGIPDRYEVNVHISEKLHEDFCNWLDNYRDCYIGYDENLQRIRAEKESFDGCLKNDFILNLERFIKQAIVHDTSLLNMSLTVRSHLEDYLNPEAQAALAIATHNKFGFFCPDSFLKQILHEIVGNEIYIGMGDYYNRICLDTSRHLKNLLALRANDIHISITQDTITNIVFSCDKEVTDELIQYLKCIEPTENNIQIMFVPYRKVIANNFSHLLEGITWEEYHELAKQMLRILLSNSVNTTNLSELIYQLSPCNIIKFELQLELEFERSISEYYSLVAEVLNESGHNWKS